LALIIKEILGDLGTNHQNIRNFMKTGWDGIAFYGEALELKKIFNNYDKRYLILQNQNRNLNQNQYALDHKTFRR
jgi:hypothetical protein